MAGMRLIAFAAAVAAKAFATELRDPIQDDFDCKMRTLALDYAEYIQPWRSADVFQGIADALNGTPEKAADCTVTYEGSRPTIASGSASRFRQPPLVAPRNGGITVYVSPTGSDSNNGTIDAPMKTLPAALAATRANEGWDTIVMRQGTYYASVAAGVPNPTLALGPADSGLTVQAFPGEDVWLSGGVPLVGITWNVSNITTTQWVMVNNSNTVYNQVPSAAVWDAGTTTTAEACQAICQANYTAGGPSTVWTWHDANQGEYALHCYLRSDGRWDAIADGGHVSGRLAPGKNIWAASLAGLGLQGVPGLRWNGNRLIRARYPNANPETDGFMPPAVIRANSWTPQSSPRAPDTQIDLPASYLDRNTTVSSFQTYTAGIGGTCDRFQPDAGYWCSNNVQGGGSVIYYVPTAMQADNTTLPNLPYKNATGAIIQTWRPGHWASWMYEVGAVTTNATGMTNFELVRGGFQGSRGEDTGEDTYIENVYEELDAPAEWWYDEVAQVLYLWHNATAGIPPPSDGSLVVPQTKWLFNITGTQAAPVTDVSIVGIGIRDTTYTYMDPHSIPSGGDWTLERSSVIFIEGTQRTTVSGCVFERIDGNAIVVSAYNRNVSIVHNEFVWIGATAVALWGNTYGGAAQMPPGYGADGTAGDQPRYTEVAYNLCHELGIWEKQSSFYTQFKSTLNHIHDNIVYNGPRAHINFNDGFGGGALLERNLIFNSCRESGDHGPFNSWDRDPYFYDADGNGGSPTLVKKYDEIRHNFIIANYNSLGAVDNDDGSCYYYTHHNFFVYGNGGLKNDFQGHDNIWTDNVIAYITQYAAHNGYGGSLADQLDGHEDQLLRNTVVLTHDGDYALPICSGQGKTILGNNTVYTPTGTVTECGQTLTQWQANGGDPGTVATAVTAAVPDALIGIGRSLLFN